MRFKRHIELKKGQLDIAPLIDVVFLLLIFFMLTSSFISPQGIKVNLPGAKSSKAVAIEDLVIFITGENSIYVNDISVTPEELEARIEEAAEDKSHILIKADKEAFMGEVIRIWDLCRDAGITDLNIATAPKEK